MSFAARDDQSRGRAHNDPYLSEFSSVFWTDRQRIVQCSAFRRLEYKTQVFVNHEGDHFRTRLTHTLEVAQLARRLARALGIHEDLAEAIALAHDLGHPPFGHAGESVLKTLLEDAGGFEHNAQAFRVVTELERPYPDFTGLNLTWEVREGLLKHHTCFDQPDGSGLSASTTAPFVQAGPHPLLEGQVVGLADRMTYDCHDLEDGLEAGLIEPDLLAEIPIWAECAAPIVDRHPSRPLPALRRPILEALQTGLIRDAVQTTRNHLRQAGLTNAAEVRKYPDRIASFSGATENRLRELEALLTESVYEHPRVIRMDAKGRRIVEQIFAAYLAEPRLLPSRYARRIEHMGEKRVLADYIAGMTDRFCQDEYKRLFTPFERV